MTAKLITILALVAIKSLYAADILFPSCPFFQENFDTAEELPNYQSKLISDGELPIIMGNISHLLATGTDPKQVVCIFDVDGTLTDESDPTYAGETAYPRSSSMIHFVRNLHDLGINVIASSAWNVFEHTVNRIKRLGLIDVFITPEAVLSKEPVDIGDRTFLVQSLGKIISVKDSQTPSAFYRSKFISTLVSRKELAIEGSFPYTHVFFFDDSERNINIFRSDFRWFFEGKEPPHAFAYLLNSPMPNTEARKVVTTKD